MVWECNDGLDNDSDGLTDFPDDPGCRDALWTSENPECQDGIDNDGDGLIDFQADPGCQSKWALTESPECNDGIDNDGDTRIDLDDPSCVFAFGNDESWVWFPSCGLGIELTLMLAPLLLIASRRRGGRA
jgi:hypothetical protein